MSSVRGISDNQNQNNNLKNQEQNKNLKNQKQNKNLKNAKVRFHRTGHFDIHARVSVERLAQSRCNMIPPKRGNVRRILPKRSNVTFPPQRRNLTRMKGRPFRSPHQGEWYGNYQVC